jgi:hypothetical protein
MPLVSRERLEQSAGSTLVATASLVADGADETLHAQHAAQARFFTVDVREHNGTGVIFDDFGSSHGAAARYVAFAADALSARFIERGGLVIDEMLQAMFFAGAGLAVLAKVGSDFALFGHRGAKPQAGMMTGRQVRIVTK